MDKGQIKEKIEKKLRFLSEDIAELKEYTKPISPENSIGRVSRMDAINNKAVNDAALRNAEVKYKALKEALLTIDNSDFGICKSCKQEIQFERLLIMPESRICIGCARR